MSSIDSAANDDRDDAVNRSRRDALKKLGQGAVAVAAWPLVLRAADVPEDAVSESGDQAIALGYRHDTADVDGAKYPRHDVSQNCLNCRLYQSQEAWGACPLFPGRQVSAAGWCSAWVPRAG